MQQQDSKKVLIALPIAFLEEVDEASHVEHRTRSDFIREALRHYLYYFRKRQADAPRARMSESSAMQPAYVE